MSSKIGVLHCLEDQNVKTLDFCAMQDYDVGPNCIALPCGKAAHLHHRCAAFLRSSFHC
jgi:hypothetical protein